MSTKKHPLVGKFLHTFKDAEHEMLNYQGEIISVDGDTFLVQLFDWMHGSETVIQPMPKEFVYSPLCVIYTNHTAWRIAADKYNCRKDREHRLRLVKEFGP